MSGNDTRARSASEPDRQGSKVELSPVPPVDRVKKSLVLLAALAGLIVLVAVTFQGTGSRQAPSDPGRTGFEVPPLSPEHLERLKSPSPSVGLAELLGLTRAPETAPQKAAAEALPLRRTSPRRPSPPSRPAPLRVELRPHPGGTAIDPAGDGPSTRQRAEQRAEELLRRVTADTQDSPAQDPRQLPRPTEHATAVAIEPPRSPYELKQGSFIPALLAQRVSSEIGGLIRAQVSSDVYDSLTHRHLLIPRGTLALGLQERQPLAGERRVVVSWQRLVFPDGGSLELASEPAAGQDGSLGLAGKLNRHWGQRFGSAALISVVSAGLQLAQPQRSAAFGAAADAGQIAAGAAGLELGRLSQEILRDTVDLPPTVELEPGAPIHILLTRDLAFERPWTPSP